jgi:hypothetical protein
MAFVGLGQRAEFGQAFSARFSPGQPDVGPLESHDIYSV